MKKEMRYLVPGDYMADPAVHIFNDRVYIYPSHDWESGIGENDNGDHFNMKDYHVFSTDDIMNGEIKDHGVVLQVEDIPWAGRQLWDCDVVLKDGRYYMYFPLKDQNDIFRIGVAISDNPEGPFIPKANPMKGSYSIDPAVFDNGDGDFYIYFGGLWGGQLQRYRDNKALECAVLPEGDEQALPARVAKLSKDMLEFAEEPKALIILDENGKPIDIKPYEKSIATNMIEEFMLVCNETIAENSFWQEMPFMYRSHQEPDEDKLEKMEQFLRGFGYYLRKKDGEIHPRELQKVLQKAEETDEERIITRMVLRSMMQARYTAENGGHFGLAAKYYCHFTSPIRRYPDLEIHRMIKKMLHGELDEKASAYYRRKMPDWAKHCSKQERVAEDAERDTDALKKVEFMEDKVGQIYEGIISGVTNWGIYVELPNTIEGMVALSQMDDDYYEFDEKKMLVFGKRTKKSYRLGDKVLVSVAKVDRMMGTIDFVFEEENEDFQE